MNAATQVRATKAEEPVTDVTTDQYLTFSLAGEEYGVDILTVQEVKVWTRVTVLPNTPDFIRGVLNLRGVIMPIIDLRSRFRMPAVDYSETTVIVILKLTIASRERIVGLVVDAVSDVLDIPRSAQKSVDSFEMSSRSEAITGIATINNKLVIMLDTAKLLERGDLQSVDQEVLAM
jgi:purine-binding chemotaxis protein CheW